MSYRRKRTRPDNSALLSRIDKVSSVSEILELFAIPFVSSLVVTDRLFWLDCPECKQIRRRSLNFYGGTDEFSCEYVKCPTNLKTDGLISLIVLATNKSEATVRRTISKHLKEREAEKAKRLEEFKARRLQYGIYQIREEVCE